MVEGPKKKILFITVRSDIGGGPKHVFDLVSGVRKNARCYIASPLDEPFGKKFITICEKHMAIAHRKFSIITLFKLILFCRTNKIDIIHSHGRGAGIYSRLLYIFGYRIVHTFHGIHDEKNFIAKIKIVADKLLKHLCHRFICVSIDETVRSLKKAVSIEDKIVVINNGVDVDLIQSAKTMPLRSQLGISEDKVIIGTLARPTYPKGIDLLLDILSKHKLDPSWVFVIAGGGGEEFKLKDMATQMGLNDVVKFYGPTYGPYSFLKAIDIYFSTSRWEGLPISVLEAMAAKKACVLSNVTGHTEIAKKEGEVLLHNFDDFIGVINKAINNRSHLEESSFNLVKEHYSLEKMIDKTMNLYKGM